jgi:toxin CcdB
MSRFDVYPNPDADGFLLDVQADILSLLNTRVVVPLMPQDGAPKPMHRLNPVFEVGGKRVVMMTHYIAAVPAKILSDPIGDLAARRHEVVDALDFLQQGF